MKRRSFFQALSAAIAALLLPPIRAAKAVQQRVKKRVKPVTRWLSGRQHWEHLEEPIPAPFYSSYVTHPEFEDVVPLEENDAKIVCRVFGGNHHARTNVGSDAAFEAALEEAGWSPEQIQNRMSANYGNWGVSVPCAACDRRVWIPRGRDPEGPEYLGWQLDGSSESSWVARCPDHRIEA